MWSSLENQQRELKYIILSSDDNADLHEYILQSMVMNIPPHHAALHAKNL